MTSRKTSLAEYVINIRSFHPKKYFPYTGFEGDNRRFNLEPNSAVNTSRIWQKVYANLSKPDFSTTEGSHPSNHPLLDQPVPYNDPMFRPEGGITSVLQRNPGQGRIGFTIQGYYRGSNHAMPGSKPLKDAIGTTYVPAINVNYELRIDIDRIDSFMDMVLYVTGDGFPNCEAFLVGPSGKSVFLGVHVREGVAPVSLSLNPGKPMIACALRLPLSRSGALQGYVGDELKRRVLGNQEIRYQPIEEWNQFFRSMHPNGNCPTLPTKGELEQCFP